MFISLENFKYLIWSSIICIFVVELDKDLKFVIIRELFAVDS